MSYKSNEVANMIIVGIICGTFSGIVLIIYLLNIGKIGSIEFTTLFICIILAGLAWYRVDSLKEIDIKNMRLVLEQVKEARRDVYAKVETVKKIGENLADLPAFSVSRIGRFASDDLQIKMLEGRDRVKEVLQEIGSDQEKIDKISSQIEEIVLSDLKQDALQGIRNELIKLCQDKQSPCEVENKYNGYVKLFEKYDRVMIEKVIKEQGFPDIDIVLLLDRVDKFIKTKQI